MSWGELMKKKVLHDYDIRKASLLATTETAAILKLNNGSILKIFHPEFIRNSKLVNLEQKVLDAVPIKHSPEILVPTSAVYSETGQFCGYTMPEAVGIDYNTYDDKLTIAQRQDLRKYAQIHSKLEKVLRRNKDIVFPDFCTCDNIFVDNKGNVQFIDYDGLQVGGHRALSISTSLGDPTKLLDTKYGTKDLFFTKELDKRSSIVLYFLTAFNVNLNNVGIINPDTGIPVTLDDFFEIINLDDQDVCHKVWKTFQDDQQNEFLGDDVFRLADKYDVKILDIVGDTYIKELVKK